MSDQPTKTNVKAYAHFWHNAALDNLKTAVSLLRSKRYNFTMFMCQQTIEAILKCAYIKLQNDRPPFLHKLPRLLTMTGIKVPLWLDKVILRVDAHYIKARYFEDRFNPLIYNHKNASELLTCTRKALEWFTKELELKS